MIAGARVALREVRTFILVLITLLALFSALRRWRLVALLTVLLCSVFYFFRDPERLPDSEDEDVILAPADGLITRIEAVEEQRFLRSEAHRITTFLSIFNVHVQRCPHPGTVAFVQHQAGHFAPAFLTLAEENEANFLGIETKQGALLVAQMAALVTRRIVCWAAPGDKLALGQRFGLIKFGSRVDLYLPPDVEIMVTTGQRIYGGQTVVARWPARSSTPTRADS